MKAFLVIIIFSLPIRGEWFTSLCHMERLLDEETSLLSSLKDYIYYETGRMKYLQGVLEIMNDTSCNSAEDVGKCIENPSNQYALMKRLAHVWEGLRNAVADKNASEKFLWTIDRARQTLPTYEDVVGSITGIMRIQQMYGFPVFDLARGVFGNSKSGTSLSAGDCYDFGELAYANNNSWICADWQEVAIYKLKNGDTSVSAEDVLYSFAKCVYAHGNLPMAYETMRELVRFSPNFIEAADFYRQVMAEAEKLKLSPFRGDFTRVLESYASQRPEVNISFYEQLCRKTQSFVTNDKKTLRCYLWDGNRNPRLLFRPIKVEIENENPFLARFYDFISDAEIEDLKKISSPLMFRAKVSNPDEDGVGIESEYRVTKTVFLNEKHYDVIAKINRKLADTTNFNMKFAETLSVSNYGVGGHYSDHVDAFGVKKGKLVDVMGDRIATVLTYLSDVEQGGNTVFPTAGIAIKPLKGSAVMWYNLLTNGSVDMNTLHAGCPVVAGDKWITNSWIRHFAVSTCDLCEGKSCPRKTHRMSFESK